MARADYIELVLESYLRKSTSGHRNPIGIRPADGQLYPQAMEVECSRHMIDTERYPLGTKFLVRVCIKQKLDGRKHLYSHYSSVIIPISNAKAKELVSKYPGGRAFD